MAFRRICWVFVALVAFALGSTRLSGQETTGGLQGTVTDPSGAAVPNAHLSLTGTSLIGSKELNTDEKGYYHFANLPPGTYSIKVTAPGFAALDRGGLVIEVGHLPTVDLQLQLGAATATIEVTGAAPVIDVTTTHNVTNVTSDVLQNIPHGYSFQSALQYVPMARTEPLAGGVVGPNASGNTGNAAATGGQSAGSATNGQAFGFSVGGGADSENAYLVEGQETADAIGGFSHTNVPFSFIQEMQVKSSGVEAEYGGALGGVVNVVMQKGSNAYHGSAFAQFERGGWDGSPNAYLRYDPGFTPPPAGTSFLPDATPQQYQPKKDALADYFWGFTLGGPLLPRLKDKLWFFVGFNPEFRDRDRVVNWDFLGNAAFPAVVGPTPFSSNAKTYYTNARVDWAATTKIRAFGSWLYEYQRANGEFLPAADSTTGLINSTATSPAAAYANNLGNAAPNLTTNVGADITISSRLVATFRWGYNFQNYHDFGMPTGGAFDAFLTSGAGSKDNLGNPIPASSQLSQIGGFVTAPNNINNTTYNATHRNQINADLAWYQKGWGEHNFKFGYQFSRLSNSVEQHFNEPAVNVLAGGGNYYTPQGPVGEANCAPLITLYGGCAGQYGYFYLYDYGSFGRATSDNNAFYVQDSWNLGKGFTINAGVRFEHEYLPAEQQPAGGISKPIQFGWDSKIAPRIGAAWDPFRNGKWKVFGSYGKFYDVMKLNLAISSFGGQYWQNCYYALNTQDLASIVPVFNSAARYCVGPNSASQGNFGAAGPPPGIVFLENQNFRTFPTSCATCTATEEGVAPGLKPYQQHESVFGVDHGLSKDLFFEVRWDRRRLDNAIEDSSIFNPNIGETFVIVNPGKGVNRTFDGFWNFLYGSPSGCSGATCPPNNIPAARSYDGVEFRLTKATSHGWAGMFSYTYSHFRGNYTGLTNTDISDGGGGRNAPNNSRAFDEPFMSWTANGTSDSGNLPTDRPNVFKGYAYYEHSWLRSFVTNVGIFQYAYQGSPVSTYGDVGYSFSPTFGAYNVPSAEGGAFNQYIVGRNWLPISQAADGTLTIGTPYARRTPWFTQTDLQLTQAYKISESKSVSFSITVPNALNQHAIVAYWESFDSNFYPQYLTPGGLPVFAGYPFYKAAESPYDYKSLFSSAGGSTGTSGVMTINSLYGKPLYYQLSRNIYMMVKFTF